MINRCCKHEKAVLNITTETKQQQQQQIGANKYQKPRSHLQDCKTFLQVVGAKQNRVFPATRCSKVFWESDQQQQEDQRCAIERRSRCGTKEGKRWITTSGSRGNSRKEQQQQQEKKRSVRAEHTKKKGLGLRLRLKNAVKQTRRQLVKLTAPCSNPRY
jgi:hypothetical protein